MQTVYVLVEEDYDIQPNEFTIIGVFDTPHKALDGMKEYYGTFDTINQSDIEDSGVEWVKSVIVKGNEGWTNRYKVTLLSFQLNRI